MAGYSGTPLPKKLGLKLGFRCAFPGAPGGFVQSLKPLPPGAKLLIRPAKLMDLLVLFCRDASTLKRQFAPLASLLSPAGMLWIAWPKKSSGVPTDLSENMVREHGLSCGLVDVKVCAIDQTWSGLKFVIRLKSRKA